MTTIKTSAKKQKHQHLKRKERFSSHLDLGTPKVPLSNNQRQHKHELLSEWEHAS